MGALFDFKCTCDSTLVYVCQADAEKCIFVWTILSQTPRRTPQVTSDASRISAGIFWLFPKERRMLRKRDYQGRLSFHFFDRWMTDLATHRQKKSKQCPGKICRCSNSAFLHGVEWDRLIVHRTRVAYRQPYKGCPFECNLAEITRNETVWRMRTNNVKGVYYLYLNYAVSSDNSVFCTFLLPVVYYWALPSGLVGFMSPAKGYLRETYKSQNINLISLTPKFTLCIIQIKVKGYQLVFSS